MFFLKSDNASISQKHRFCKFQLTAQPLATLKIRIQQVFYTKNCFYYIFVDLSKSHDIVWYSLILRNLTKIRINGQIIGLSSFLNNRKIIIRIKPLNTSLCSD